MEGDPISVAESITLPAQPGTGVVTYVPLGGDGYEAPFAAYIVDVFQLTGIAGGGTAIQTVVMDEKFCSLIQYATWSIDQGTPLDAEFRLRIGAQNARVPLLVDQGTESAITATVSSSNPVGRTWTPTPIILPATGGAAPFLEAAFLNVQDDEYRLSINVFLFNIRVRELTPMGPLLWSRGST